MIRKSLYGMATLLIIMFSTGTSAVWGSGENAASAISGMTGKATGMLEKINLNTASIESLSQIPGLSPKIGEAIAAYREANGAFKSISDLVNIEGIDAGLVEKIKPFLTI